MGERFVFLHQIKGTFQNEGVSSIIELVEVSFQLHRCPLWACIRRVQVNYFFPEGKSAAGKKRAEEEKPCERKKEIPHRLFVG